MSASANKSPAGILVRRVQFEYPVDLAAHWHPEKPEWSQVVDAASLLTPTLEPFLLARGMGASQDAGNAFTKGLRPDLFVKFLDTPERVVHVDPVRRRQDGEGHGDCSPAVRARAVSEETWR